MRHHLWPQPGTTRAPHCGRFAAALLAAWLLAGVGTGCQPFHYYATSLPSEFQAPPIGNTDAIDLSQLVGSPFRDDMIYAGDVLKIQIATGYEEKIPNEWSARVSEDGTVSIPLVGEVPVAGMELVDAESAIRQAGIQRQVYRNPYVTVEMDRHRANQVTVMGAVNKPGAYDLPIAGSDLLAALVAAEGLSEDADTVLEIRRPQRHGAAVQRASLNSPYVDPSGRRYPRGNHQQLPEEPALDSVVRPDGERPNIAYERVDLLDLAHAPPGAHRLEDGSVVMVMKQAPRHIHVLGLVHRPNQYELPKNQEIRVLDAIAIAGGLEIEQADKVHVIRQTPGGEPVVVGISVRDAKQNGQANLRLAPGDVVSVEETPVTVLIRTFRDFVRGVGFTAGVPGL